MLSAADLEIRRTGIGASEAWKVVEGKGAHDVWLRLVHPELAQFHVNVAMRKGTILEGLVAELYGERHGIELVGDGAGTRRHPEHPMVLATIDRITPAGDKLVEIKCPTWRTKGDWGHDGSQQFPLKYRIQCLIQMAVTGVRSCDLTALIEGEDEVRVYPVAWDEELAELVIDRLRRFWHDHVVTKEPPPADGSASASEMLSKRFPKNTGTTRPASDETIVSLTTGDTWAGDVALARELASIRASKKQLEERERLLVNLAKERTGDLDGVEGCWSWKAPAKGNGTTAWKAVAQELAPSRELIAKHTTPAARTFRLLGQED